MTRDVVVWNDGDPDFQLKHGGYYKYCWDLGPFGGATKVWAELGEKFRDVFGGSEVINVKGLGYDLDIWQPYVEENQLVIEVDSFSTGALIALGIIAAVVGIVGYLILTKIIEVIEVSGVGDIGKALGDGFKRLAELGWMTPILVVAAIIAVVLLLPTMVGSGKKAIKGLS